MEMLLDVDVLRVLPSPLQFVRVLRLVVVAPDHLGRRRDALRDGLGVEPEVPLPGDAATPDRMGRSRRRAAARVRARDEVAARTPVPVRTLDCHAGLRRLVGPAADRRARRAPLLGGEQGLSPVFVALLAALASDVEVEDVARNLRERDVSLVSVPLLQPGSRLGSVPELQYAGLGVVVVEVERDHAGHPRTDVPEDLQERVANGPAPARVATVERQQGAGVFGRELGVGGLLLVVELDRLDRQVESERDESLRLQILDPRPGALLPTRDRDARIVLREQVVGVPTDVPAGEVADRLDPFGFGVLLERPEVPPVGAGGLTLPVGALAPNPEIHRLGDGEIGRVGLLVTHGWLRLLWGHAHSTLTLDGYLRSSLVRSESGSTSTPHGRLTFLYAIRRIHYRGSNGRTWLSATSGSPCGPAAITARSALLRGLVDQRRVRKCFRR